MTVGLLITLALSVSGPEHTCRTPQLKVWVADNALRYTIECPSSATRFEAPALSTKPRPGTLPVALPTGVATSGPQASHSDTVALRNVKGVQVSLGVRPWSAIPIPTDIYRNWRYRFIAPRALSDSSVIELSKGVRINTCTKEYFMIDLYRLLSLQALKLSTMRRTSFSSARYPEQPLGLRPISDALKDVLYELSATGTQAQVSPERLLFGLAMKARPSR